MAGSLGYTQAVNMLEKNAEVLAMQIPQSYYALRRQVDENSRERGQIDFLRVSYPKTGHLKGTMKVQSQHSDQLNLRLVIPIPSHSPLTKRVQVLSPYYVTLLFDLPGDLESAQILYGTEKERCFSCAKKLTDERSRYYGFGPECEKHLQHHLQRVDELKGEYYPGKMLDDQRQAEELAQIRSGNWRG